MNQMIKWLENMGIGLGWVVRQPVPVRIYLK